MPPTERESGGEEVPRIKLVVVGDGAVGKTCLLVTFTENRYPEEYEPTIYENWQKELTVDGKPIKLDLWDTAGQETYDRIRPLSYPKTDVFLLCYDISQPTSLINIELKWLPEIKSHCPEAKVILVGNKCDLRDEPSSKGKDMIKKSQATRLYKKKKLDKSLECSSRLRLGINQVFEDAVRAVINKKPPKSSPCSIM